MNQIKSGIAPDVAMSTSGLYSDTNEAFDKSMEFYGGIENWIKLFVGEASKELLANQQNKEKKQINELEQQEQIIS